MFHSVLGWTPHYCVRNTSNTWTWHLYLIPSVHCSVVFLYIAAHYVCTYIDCLRRFKSDVNYCTNSVCLFKPSAPLHIFMSLKCWAKCVALVSVIKHPWLFLLHVECVVSTTNSCGYFFLIKCSSCSCQHFQPWSTYCAPSSFLFFLFKLEV